MNIRWAGEEGGTGSRSRSVGMAIVGAAGLASCLAGSALGDDRRFGFVEEATMTVKGGFEFEQWVTWGSHNKDDNGFNRVDFKHEFEYGISENLQLGIDVAEWHFTTGDDKQGPRYDVTAAELKYRFMDRVKDPIGLALKGEVAIGPEVLGLEGRLIIDKALDRMVLAYNLKIEAEWEGEDYGYHDSGGEISQSLGASYELSPQVYFGGEALWEMPFPDWHTGETQDLFLGPNLSYRGHSWAVTTTALGKVTGGDDAPSFQLRMLFEFDF